MNEDTPLNESTDVVPADMVQETPEIEAALPSAGAQLKALREARGWTVVQVANQLNLASRQIEALEQDNYAALPGMVIVRGFIRTYAKLLQADAAPILAAIRDESAVTEAAPPRSSMSAPFSETQLKSEKSRSFPLKTVIGLVAVLGVAAAALFQSQGLRGKPGPQVEKTNEAAAPAVAQETPVPASGVEDAAAAPAVAETHDATDSAAVSQVAAEVKPAEQKSAPAAKGKNVLAIQAHQDSWVEIRRADDTVLFSSLLKAGASEAIELPGPVSMVVGNAAGVDVTLRGAPVDMKGNASNVARLNLK